MVESRIFYLNLNWSVETASNFMFKVDLPVKFPIFHYGSSTSQPFNLQDLIVDSPFKVLHISL